MMMQGLRNAGQSWLGKIVVGVLFSFLILSFAIWGIGDIFRGAGTNQVAAQVGESKVSADAVRQAYQTEVQRLTRQLRRAITPDLARAFGIESTVLNRLVTQATLDEEARRRGLAISDAAVAQSIVSDPAFRGSDGQFSRIAFDNILREAGYTEQAFIAEQRRTVLRQQIAEATTAGVTVPVAMLEAIHRYGTERRSIDYIVLPASRIGEIPAPDEATLRSFYEARKLGFAAPEYRRLNVLVLTPNALAAAASVSEADVLKRYEEVKDTRFGSPERRTIDQVVFQSADEAKATSERIKAGASLDEIATSRGLSAGDLRLGTVTRAEMIDPAVAAAAFALAEGAVSEPVAGRFGSVIVRVAAIEPARTRPFAEVAPEIRAELASSRGRARIDEIHDRIEDQRASARPLEEIAREQGIPLTAVQAVSRAGLDKAGTPVADLPERDALLQAAFASDIGIDNEALRLRDGGYAWFEIAGIEPARERAFDEVKALVDAQWRADESSRRLGEQARAIVARLDKGELLAAIAAELGLVPGASTDIGRETDTPDLPRNVVTLVFATPQGKAGQATRENDRVVFSVGSVTVPPFLRTSNDMAQIEPRLRSAVAEDVLGQHVAQMQKAYGLTINDRAVRTALGTAEN
jgi:peptidyl-prolyl cis-trans isomerase D